LIAVALSSPMKEAPTITTFLALLTESLILWTSLKLLNEKTFFKLTPVTYGTLAAPPYINVFKFSYYTVASKSLSYWTDVPSSRISVLFDVSTF